MTKKIIIIAVLAVFVLGGLGAAIALHVHRNSGVRLLHRAEVAMQAKNFQTVADMAERYVADTPDDWHGHDLLGKACLRLGRYAQARKAFQEAGRLAPTEVGPVLGLASTYSVPVQELTDPGRDRASVDELKKALKRFRKANVIILEAKKAQNIEPKALLDLQERLGGDYRRIFLAWYAVVSRLEDEVDQQIMSASPPSSRELAKAWHDARIARDEKVKPAIKKLRDEEMGVHLRGALDKWAVARADRDNAAALAIETLLGVVRQDPSRPRAGLALVEACIQHGDDDSLNEVREKFRGLDAPPVLAVMALAFYDLQSGDDTNEEEQKEKLREFCGKLDKLLARDPEHLKVNVARAKGAFELDDLATAERICKSILRKSGRHREARLIQAGILLRRREFREAESQLFTLKMNAPDWADVHYFYALAAWNGGRQQAAMQAMRAVVKIRPSYGRAMRFLAESLIRDGYFDQAFTDAAAYYKFYPGSPTAVRLYVQSAVGLEIPRLKLARQAVEKARAEHGDEPDMMFVVGQAYERFGEKAKAREAFTRAAGDQCKATSFAGRMAKTRSLRRIGRTSEAEKILTDELTRRPDKAIVHFELGMLCAGSGRLLQAADYIQAAVRLDEGNEDYSLALARLWFDLGDIARCRSQLESIGSGNAEADLLRMRARLVEGQDVATEDMIEQIGRSPRAGLALAMTYLRAGQPAWCITVCQEGLKSSPDDPMLRFLMGQAYLVMDKLKENPGRRCFDQWILAIRTAPRRLPPYLGLGDLLSRGLVSIEKGKKPRAYAPAEVGKILTHLTEAESDNIRLTVGWLHTRLRDYSAAADVYGRLADDAKAPLHSRRRARILLAQSLASEGKVDRGLGELDKLSGQASEWRNAGFARAEILLSAGRTEAGVKALDELAKLAMTKGKEDPAALRRITKQLVRLGRFDEALARCDDLAGILPNDAASHLLRAVTFNAAGRGEEALASLREAVKRQPLNLELYLAQANVLDSLQRPAEALAALERMALQGRPGKARALFERGRLMSRWGLEAQAVEAFERLDAGNYSESPVVNLALGRALASFRSRDAAKRAEQVKRIRKLLSGVSVYSQQYVPAQLVLADLAEESRDRQVILAQVVKDKPKSAEALDKYMRTLLDLGENDEAVKTFESFGDRADRAQSAAGRAYPLALIAKLRAGQRDAAARFARQTAAKGRSRQWRHMAILLSIDTDAALATAMLPDRVDQAPLRDALLGVVLASQAGDAKARDAWARRVEQISRKVAEQKPPRTVEARLRLLSALSAGQAGLDRAELVALAKSCDVGPAPADELVQHRAAGPPVEAEAAKLLKATLAVAWGLKGLGRDWAMEALQARPQCQWAAALIMQSSPDAETHRKVVALLAPSDCALALRVRGSLLRNEGEFADAALLYARAARAAGGDWQLVLAQAVATERAGDLDGALALYRKVWQETRDPQAGNNAAYIVSQRHPGDRARLAEAMKWADAAVDDQPANATFLDTRGWLAFLLGRTDQARADVLRAVKLRPRSPDVHYHVGAVTDKAGHSDLARWHFQAAIACGEAMEADGRKLTVSDTAAVNLAEQALARGDK